MDSKMKKGGMPMVMKDGKKVPAFLAKAGGKAKMKKMAMGGGMPMGALASAAPAMGMKRPMMGARPDSKRAMMEAAMAQAAAARPMMRKKGGEVESKAMHSKEERQIKGIKKDLMSHEGKPASKAHAGLKTGGLASKYKKGGMAKFATGGVVNGFKDGGSCGMKSGGEAGFARMKKGNC